MENKKLLSYLPNYKKIGFTCLSVLCITLLTSFFGFTLKKILGHETAFNQALDLLYHYPKSASSIIAFSATCFILLAVTFLDDSSKRLDWLRRYAIWPSMHILSHMLCLCVGVFWALAIIESISKREFAIFYHPIFINLIVISFGSLLLITAAHLSESFFSDKENPFLIRLGKYKSYFLIVVGFVILLVFVPDFIYNFTSRITQTH